MRVLPILFLFAISCSPQKRLDRLLKNHPGLITKDTVFKTDTLLVPSISSDSLFPKDLFYDELERGDTVVIEKERLVTKIFRIHDTIKVSTFAPGDTVVRTIKVPMYRIQVKESSYMPWWVWPVILFLAACLFLALYKRK